MAALPLPQYGIEHIYLYPCYMTPAEYRKATGKDAPWNPSKPPKYWEDPQAKNSTRRAVIYDRALVLDEKGFYVAGQDGKPLVDILALTKDEAASVNIPPNFSSVPGADAPFTPPPLRALEPNEELVFALGNVPVVRNKDAFAAVANGFTVEDREVLRSIAKKLGL